MYLTQKITRKAAELVKDEELQLELIFLFNEKSSSLLGEYDDCPSIELENKILSEFEMFCIEEQYCF
jgi:hypothetical protein